MKYSIEFGPKAKKVMKKLPDEISLRIINKLKSITADPFRFLEHFEGDNLFKLRIGYYRALIEADFVRMVLVVRILDKRGRIYKR
jgi:mRNA-degrading endonuclease RelE of RelBE toxin-antitoxin system